MNETAMKHNLNCIKMPIFLQSKTTWMSMIENNAIQNCR